MAREARHLKLKLLVFFLGLWLAALAVALPIAALPDEAGGRVLVVFPPSLTPDDRLLAILAAEGRPVLPRAGELAWLAESETAGFVGRLKQAGALAAFPPDLFAVLPQGGCFYISVHPPGPPQPHPPI
jgi:hypothetical protein